MITSAVRIVSMVISLLSVFISIWAQGPPEQSVDDQRIVFAHVGKPALLRCPIKSDPATDKSVFVDWKRGEESLYLEEGFNINDKGILRIKEIKLNDQGLYTCCATNGFGSVIINVSLVVYAPPSQVEGEDATHPNVTYPKSLSRIYGAPKIKRPLKKTYVEEIGTIISIKCVASGYPTPHIFWLKDGHLEEGAVEKKKDQLKNQSLLKLRIVQKSNAGVYTCVAKNEFGVDQTDFSVNVRDPLLAPTIKNLQPLNVTVSVRDTVIFWCEVGSNSGLKLHVKWLKSVTEEEMQYLNRTFRLENNYYKTVQSKDVVETSQGIFRAKLLISDIKVQDSGTYVCLAVNDKGYTHQNATLHVTASKFASSLHFITSANATYLVSIVVSTSVVVIAFVVLFSIVYKCRTPQKVMTADGVKPCSEAQPLTPQVVPRFGDERKGTLGNTVHLTSVISSPCPLALDGTQCITHTTKCRNS